ncbi:hypothetical protein ABIB44_001546 [Hymenobacter sp. UYCo722]
MLRLPLNLSLGLLLLVGGCKAQVVLHEREASSRKVLTWAIGPVQQQLLAHALHRAGRVSEPDLALLKRFYYRPVVTNQRGEGLYYVTQFTHRGPIGVLRSKRGISTVEIGLTDVATQDSVALALIRHRGRFNQRLRQAILNEYRQ